MVETPPPDLVRGCDSPEGIHILADWLDEHGGDGSEFREMARDSVDLTPGGCGAGNQHGWGDGSGDGDGSPEYGDGDGDGRGDGLGYTFPKGFGHGDAGFGEPGGDGGRGLMRLET